VPVELSTKHGRDKTMNDAYKRRSRRVRSARSAVVALGSLAVVVSLALSGCSSSGSSGDATGPLTSTAPTGQPTTGAVDTISTPTEIKQAGALNVCADLTYPPMTFMQNSNPAGFDVDLANALAQEMGSHAEFHQTGFPAIIAALNGKKCDAIMNGMNGTPQRGKEIDMIPYLEDGHGFAVQKGNPEHLESVDDLAGKRVATQLGSSDQQYLEDMNKQLVQNGKKKINIVTYSQDPAAFEALGTGKVDAFFQDLVVLGYYAQRFGDAVSVANVSVNQQSIIIGLRKSDTQLHDALTQALAHAYSDGTVAQIAKKWGIPEMNLLPKSQ
jgi:polar amino acid transport system substrate-binding protein